MADSVLQGTLKKPGAKTMAELLAGPSVLDPQPPYYQDEGVTPLQILIQLFHQGIPAAKWLPSLQVRRWIRD